MKKTFFSSFIFAVLINLACYAASPVPETTQETIQACARPTIRLGAADLQQRSNQDAHTLYGIKVGDIKMSFFGVYDGHGDNASVAQMLKNKLHKTIFYAFFSDDKTCDHSMSNSILKVIDMLDEQSKQNEGSGSTAVFGILDKSIFWIANVGDSRAIIGNLDGKIKFETHDHKPNFQLEWARIEAAGNFVYLDAITFPGKCIYFYNTYDQYPDIKPEELYSLLVTDPNCITYQAMLSLIDQLTIEEFTNRREIWRTGGGLGMSRSVGDYPKELGVVCNPDVYQISLNSNEHHFAVFATDGLWDVVTNDEVAKYVSYELRQGKNPNLIAQELISTAQTRGSNDDITVVIIVFDWPEAAEVAAANTAQ